MIPGFENIRMLGLFLGGSHAADDLHTEDRLSTASTDMLYQQQRSSLWWTFRKGEATGFFHQCTSGLDFEMRDQENNSINMIFRTWQLLTDDNSSCGCEQPFFFFFVLLFAVYEITYTVRATFY